MEGKITQRKLTSMKNLTTIFLLCFSGSTFSQYSSGYVLIMSDSTIRVPENSIVISKVSGLQTALNAKQNSLGNGGTVTQLTNKSTSVTINTRHGQITMVNSALSAAAEVSFTVNNNQVTATDIPHVCIKSVGTVGSYLPSVTAVGNGSFSITISNVSAGSLSQALVISFYIFKPANN